MKLFCGIYAIACSANGKLYIGSSRRIQQRWYDHVNRLNAHTHHNSFLQNAWDKYGAGAFSFSIIEQVSQGMLIERELFWINQLKPAFNLSIPDIASGGWTCSDETRRKRSEASKGNKSTKGQRWSAARRATPMTDDVRDKISKTLTGKPWSDARRAVGQPSLRGKQRSEEVRRKISETKQTNMAIRLIGLEPT